MTTLRIFQGVLLSRLVSESDWKTLPRMVGVGAGAAHQDGGYCVQVPPRARPVGHQQTGALVEEDEFPWGQGD